MRLKVVTIRHDVAASGFTPVQKFLPAELAKKETVSHPLYARAADFAPSAQLMTVRLTPIRLGHGPNRESPARLWPAARASIEFAPSSPEGRLDSWFPPNLPKAVTKRCGCKKTLHRY